MLEQCLELLQSCRAVLTPRLTAFLVFPANGRFDRLRSVRLGASAGLTWLIRLAGVFLSDYSSHMIQAMEVR